MTEADGSFDPFGAGAIEVKIGRGSRVALLLYGPFHVLVVAGFIYAALHASDTATAVVGWVFTGLFSLPLLFAALLFKRLVMPRSLAFDARGVCYRQGDASLLLAWEEIAGVGIGYEQPPSVPSLHLGKHVADALLGAAQIERRRYIAVEVFPANPAALTAHPLLLRFRREQQPPSPGLSPGRFRFPLPPLPGFTDQVARGVQTFQPSRWLGWFARPWRGI